MKKVFYPFIFVVSPFLLFNCQEESTDFEKTPVVLNASIETVKCPAIEDSCKLAYNLAFKRPPMPRPLPCDVSIYSPDENQFAIAIKDFSLKSQYGYFNLEHQRGEILNAETREIVGTLHSAIYDENSKVLRLNYDINSNLKVSPESIVVSFKTSHTRPNQRGQEEAVFEGAITNVC